MPITQHLMCLQVNVPKTTKIQDARVYQLFALLTTRMRSAALCLPRLTRMPPYAHKANTLSDFHNNPHRI